ncbi:MAG: hypothetical protein V4764_06150 [Burkholderia sp.]
MFARPLENRPGHAGLLHVDIHFALEAARCGRNDVAHAIAAVEIGVGLIVDLGAVDPAAGTGARGLRVRPDELAARTSTLPCRDVSITSTAGVPPLVRHMSSGFAWAATSVETRPVTPRRTAGRTAALCALSNDSAAAPSRPAMVTVSGYRKPAPVRRSTASPMMPPITRLPKIRPSVDALAEAFAIVAPGFVRLGRGYFYRRLLHYLELTGSDRFCFLESSFFERKRPPNNRRPDFY